MFLFKSWHIKFKLTALLGKSEVDTHANVIIGDIRPFGLQPFVYLLVTKDLITMNLRFPCTPALKALSPSKSSNTVTTKREACLRCPGRISAISQL